MAGPAMDYNSRKGLTAVCSTTKIINAPIEMVWAVVSSFGAIKLWMPGIESCHIKPDGPQPPEYGATRAVANLGMVMEETLEILDRKEHFCSYRLQDPCPWESRGNRGSIKLTPKGDKTTELRWSLDSEQITEEAKAAVRPMMNAFFASCIEELSKILTRPEQPYV